MVAVIGDPLLQKLMQLRSTDAAIRRVDNWLMAFFEDQLQSPNQAEGNILSMLSAVLQYAHYTKTLPSACFLYLKAMAVDWNGITGREVILALLAYTPISSFTELQAAIFQALEEAVLDGSVDSQIVLLDFYNDLLRQWSTAMLAANEHTDAHSDAIKSLINHASLLSLVILQASSSVAAYSRILDFYETAGFVGSQPSLVSLRCIVVPPSTIIYTLSFTHSINILSRLCGMLAVYKQALEAATKVRPYDKASVNRFNGLIMDICNCLWRDRAFNTNDPNANGCLIPPQTLPGLTSYVASLNTPLELTSLFNLSCAPPIALLSISYVREEEDKKVDEIELRHRGPPTQKSLAILARNRGIKLLWPDYRLGVLRYLERKGVEGITALMSNTMKHLMKK
ncbi:mis6 domain-containing protein [Phlyctema vagabunda]|uniref:Mis6 domain-containing protein n=1 Tax=Phlyctema vagabunda TaxID=108571 RepID=A0ABR4PUZ7_9HELO